MAERLQDFPCLRGCTLEQLAALSQAGEERQSPAGTEILREGADSTEIIFLFSGRLEVKRDGGHLADVGPLHSVGEMGVITRFPRSATVTAAEEAEYLLVGADEFCALLEADHEFGYKFHRNLTEILAAHLRANNLLVEFFGSLK